MTVLKTRNCLSFLPRLLPVAAMLTISIPSMAARSTVPKDNFMYSFESRNLFVYGVFNAQKTTQKNGLDAELAARQEGMGALANYLTTSCQGDEGQQITGAHLRANWQRSLRSQGSEIYSNGVLRIILMAPLRDIFKKYANTKTQNVKTTDGEPLVFQLPEIPPAAVKCGIVKMALGAKKNVSVIPQPVSNHDVSARIVRLVLTENGVLKGATPEDMVIIQKSDLLSSENAGIDPIGLPIARK